MRVRIVSYEDVNAWILGKFALKLQEHLRALSVECDISKIPDPTADINHHIIYFDYDGNKSSIDTVMVTHIDSLGKVTQLKKQLEVAKMAICMSAETVARLTLSGVPANKLTYVNPAHDEVLKPRKFVVGITSKTHDDKRKKEDELIKIGESISPEYFEFRIMGSGWNNQVMRLRELGFQVEYQDTFNRPKYLELIPTLDYFLYFSWDEGSMGFLDALCAGVKTLVTPQGFHLDAKDGISKPIQDSSDIIAELNLAAKDRAALVNSVRHWTWRNYAEKHLQIWQHLLGQLPKMPRPSFDIDDIGSTSKESFRLDRKQLRAELTSNHFRYTLLKLREKVKRRLRF